VPTRYRRAVSRPLLVSASGRAGYRRTDAADNRLVVGGTKSVRGDYRACWRPMIEYERPDQLQGGPKRDVCVLAEERARPSAEIREGPWDRGSETVSPTPVATGHPAEQRVQLQDFGHRRRLSNSRSEEDCPRRLEPSAWRRKPGLRGHRRPGTRGTVGHSRKISDFTLSGRQHSVPRSSLTEGASRPVA
jgi:hypothetical protein